MHSGGLARSIHERDQFNGPGVRELDQHETEQAVRALDSNGLALALRQGWLAFHLDNGHAGHAATSTMAAIACERAGHAVTARIDKQHLADAIRRVHSATFARHASLGLAEKHPQLSAHKVITRAQCLVLGMLAAGLVTALVIAPVGARFVMFTAFSLLYGCVSALKLASLTVPTLPHGSNRISLGDADLPIYTVLVPLFRETAILRQTISALKQISYPADRLDVKIIVEESDRDTCAMAANLVPGTGFEIIVVPRGLPQTKPRALNFALLFAKGDLVTIFDAEDVPQPMQLRMAAQRFHDAGPDLACLQARLSYYNSDENWLTRQFTIEYAALFDLMLPMLARYKLPLPLGGTSNHFRLTALRQSGGWDAWNVTEDADLGLRLARLGYKLDVLASTTFEEANCQLGNWLQQRARWLKGWMQTWLVHMRNPVRTWRELGTAGFLVAQVLMAGIVASALLHPFFLVLFFIDIASLLNDKQAPAQAAYAYGGLAVLVVGYGAAMAAGFKALRVRMLHKLLPSVAGMPVYWLLISVGGWLALWQLVRSPFHWNKTSHGISRIYTQGS